MDEDTARLNKSVQCYGCGAEFPSFKRMKLVPGAGARDGRYHCKQCYAEWLAGVVGA